jgi:glutathione peroxidase
MAETIFDFEVVSIDGVPQRLDVYRGKVLLIVNVASECGFTPQYRGLESLYRRHKDAGFVVLGFPCNQFGRQEPGTEADILKFCGDTYDVTFPLFQKIDVNGEHAHPLYKFLKAEQKGMFGTESIKWNFTKFLVDRDGNVIRRYGSRDTPEEIEIEVGRRL